MPVANMYVNQLATAFDGVGFGSKKPEQALAAINGRVQKEMDKYR